MANIAVFGAGYAGLVTGVCFAELGHNVAIRDVVPEKIHRLRSGKAPIFEPGLEDLMERNDERLTYTLDLAEALDEAEFFFVCVGTPPTSSATPNSSPSGAGSMRLPGRGPSRLGSLFSTPASPPASAV